MNFIMLYKNASKLKLRFQTTVGTLSVEQLWDLNLSQLTTTIKSVKKILKKNDDDELSFLDEKNMVDTENELRFAILKDIYLEKKSELEKTKIESERKRQREKLLNLIEEKKEEVLRNLDVDELEKKLADL